MLRGMFWASRQALHTSLGTASRVGGGAAAGVVVAAGLGLGLTAAAGSVALAEAPEPEQGYMAKAAAAWTTARAWLPAGSWWAAAPAPDVTLPTDKLRAHLPPPGLRSPGSAPIGYRPVVLVACGSFNPPTAAHLRMMELARDAMVAQGYDVLGGYLSPVADSYWKEGLASAPDRVALCAAAVSTSDWLMVDGWEAAQPRYTRTLVELQRVRDALGAAFDGPGSGARDATGAPVGAPPPPRTVLVCGADVLESMADPALWRQDLLDELLTQHGVVCVTRAGARAAALLDAPGTLLHTHRGSVTLVQEPVPNALSSSALRRELAAGRSVRYLLPDAALDCIYARGLYGTDAGDGALGARLHADGAVRERLAKRAP